MVAVDSALQKRYTQVRLLLHGFEEPRAFSLSMISRTFDKGMTSADSLVLVSELLEVDTVLALLAGRELGWSRESSDCRWESGSVLRELRLTLEKFDGGVGGRGDDVMLLPGYGYEWDDESDSLDADK
nr:hypothetical protein BaRGS_000125 [Batillaria attramentaria]